MISGVKENIPKSTNKDTTKENPLRLLNSEEFQKVVLPNSALHSPFGKCCRFGNMVRTDHYNGMLGLYR